MRSQSRSRSNDLEKSTNNTNHHHHSEASQAAQSKKRRRMKQAAGMLAILVATIIAAILLIANKDKVTVDADENAANTAPSLAPAISPNTNGKNDSDNEPSSSIPTFGNNSPTLAPPLLPTVTVSAPSLTLPLPNPTMASFPEPTSSEPSLKPSLEPTLKPTHQPTRKPTTASPSSEPTTTTDNIFDNFDESVSPTDNFQILQVVNHDSTAFTQGLYYDKNTGLLTEGTGIYGRSLVRTWDPLTGEVVRQTPTLDRAFFGEGVTWYVDDQGNERFIQITWKEQRAFIYDTDLNLLESLNYNQRTTTNEGWGITFDPVEKIFYVSDGSQYIHVWDLNFSLVGKFPVTWKRSSAATANAVLDMNELEWDPISKTILSNVWYKDYIVRIWPGTGKVIQVYDMSTLQSGGGNVLNGIAHHSANKWWITGKEWSNLYLLEFNQ